MTVQLAVTLAALLVENENLVALYQRTDYLALYLGTSYCGCTNCYCSVVVYQQDVLKFNSLTCLYILQVVNKQLLACLYLELLTVNLYDCVHFYFYLLNGFGP